MNEIQMCPEVETGVKTTAQVMYSNFNINEMNNMMVESTVKNRFEIKNTGVYCGGEFINGFIPEEVLKNTRGLYLIAHTTNEYGELNVKVGHALQESVYDRYNRTCTKQLLKQVIAVWPCNETDTKMIKDLKNAIKGTKNAGYKEYENSNETEMFTIYTKDGYYNFLDTIKRSNEKRNISKGHIVENVYKAVYEGVKTAINELDELRKKGYNVIYAELPTRWGKTRQTVKYFIEQLDSRVMVLVSYVGTVLKSYKDEVETDKRIKVIDMDDVRKSVVSSDDIKRHLEASADNKVIAFVQLTGDVTGDDTYSTKLFDERTKGIAEYCKKYGYFLVVEEADYGSKCENQIKKLNKFCKKIKPEFTFVETGTNIESTFDIFKDGDNVKCYKAIRKNYIIDVLGDKSRENAVKIEYKKLYNQSLTKYFSNYIPQEMENFSYFFELNEDGKLKGEAYLRQVIEFLYNPDRFANNIPDKNLARNIRNYKLINDKFASMLFVPENCILTSGDAFKKLVEDVVGKEYNVVIIYSKDNTTNKTAEDVAKSAIDAKQSIDDNNKVIFIAGGMANRSFSVEEIKNIILIVDGIGNAPLMQKIGRGLTPVNKDFNKKLPGNDWCNVIDFRLNNVYEGHLKELISGVAQSSIRDGMSEDDVMEILLATDKIHFYEYFVNGINPIREISESELYKIFKTNEYMRSRAMFILSPDNLESVPDPDPRCKGADKETSNGDLLSYIIDNIKGDKTTKKKRSKKPGNRNTGERSKKEVEQFDRKMQHLHFLINNMNIFNTMKYDDCEDWLYKEFEDIKSDHNIKNDYSKAWNVDMDTIIGFVDVLKRNNYKF